MATPPQPERHQIRVSLDDAVHVAMELHRQGRLDEAEGIYRRLLQANPDHIDVLHFLGMLLVQRRDLAAAEQLIRRSLALAPGYVDARNNLGNVLRHQKRDAEAELEYRRVLELAPDHADAWNNLGNVLRLQRDLRGAIAAYEQALQRRPEHAEACQNLANAYRSTQRIDEAIAMYRRALALRSDRAAMYVHLGRTLFRLGRLEEAAHVYSQWLQREPDNAIAAHMLTACGGGPAPDRASDAFVQATFDAFAEDFDEVLDELQYKAPAFIATAVAGRAGDRRGSLDVLDAGCGTGLCGPLLRPLAHRLVGVDLSPAMLTRAAERRVYDELHEAELTGWLRQHPSAFDVIAAADVLVYFGDLQQLLLAAAATLRAGGLLVFTTERTEASAAGYELHPHGRYSHTQDYLERVVGAVGLQRLTCEQVQLRLEGGEPVAGTLLVAGKS